MDNGEEIVGLNEDWTFLGANFAEWIGGFCACLIVGEVFFKGKINVGMPMMLISCIGTALFLSRVRKLFPDEHRGLRNSVMVGLGFTPPGIPKPAIFQRDWSGTPIHELDKDSLFRQIGLYEKFFYSKDQDLVDELNEQ
jgi:hypothetical protein